MLKHSILTQFIQAKMSKVETITLKLETVTCCTTNNALRKLIHCTAVLIRDSSHRTTTITALTATTIIVSSTTCQQEVSGTVKSLLQVAKLAQL